KTGGNVDSSAAIGSDGTIYVGSWDDNLYAIDPDGSKKWFYKTGGNVKSSPAIGSDGNIYFGSLDDNLYAISPDGSRKWVYQTESNVNSSPAIGANGSIYIGSSKGIMYSINSSSFGLANSPWAAYGQNSNRTARIPLLVADQIKITSFNNHAALFTLSFETKSDSTYTIEVTQDLKQWDEIGEVQGTGSSVNFTDPRLPVIPFERNYFRVKLEE
ncbi:MAG: PQQ-like beta-propeller repeat protein, partial [Verrucomicrobia bacterium]|nr:PQQ-like beta-propeller repeat protein [Verrucomicrobiota bacterium]